MSSPSRVGDVLHRHGARGVARILDDRARRALRSEHAHVWSVLSPAEAAATDRELPDGARLRAVGDDEQMPSALMAVSPHTDRRRRQEGGVQWLLEVDDRPAFSCWILPRCATWLGAPRGGFDLPAGVVNLEDSLTASEFRGRGLAPAVWDHLARDLAAQGCTALVTSVAADNVPSRRAVAKAGFVDVVVARVRFRLGQARRDVVPVGAGAPGGDWAELAGQLADRLCGAAGR